MDSNASQTIFVDEVYLQAPGMPPKPSSSMEDLALGYQIFRVNQRDLCHTQQICVIFCNLTTVMGSAFPSSFYPQSQRLVQNLHLESMLLRTLL
jgi:hypothetical protein